MNIEDVRRLANKRLPKAISDQLEGGSGLEVTLRRNRKAIDELMFASRAFVNVVDRDLRTTILGHQVRLPVLAGPAAFATLVHRDGELAVARATGNAGTICCISCASAFSMEEIAATASGPLWFEIFSCQPRDFTLDMLSRAQAAGYTAIILAVDYRAIATRLRNSGDGFSWPPKRGRGLISMLSLQNMIDFALHPRWLFNAVSGRRNWTLGNLKSIAGSTEYESLLARFRFVSEQMFSEFSAWEDLKWLCTEWKGHIVAHGVMSPDDAKRVADLGVDGIIVSNHGGRHLDWVPATIEMLPSIVDAVRGHETEIFMDGGIRHGADVVKALALGARACLVARPWFWGLAAAGENGVTTVFDILRSEIDNTLALIGRTRVSELDRSVLLKHLPRSRDEDIRDGRPNC